MPLLPPQLLGCPKAPPPAPVALAPRQDLVDTLHGVPVPDPYRWLEDGASAESRSYADARNAEWLAYSDTLPGRAELYARLQQLMRYDDETVRTPCALGPRVTWSTKAAEQDKWVVHLADGPDDPGRVIVDPNTWATTETLAGFWPSPDCRYAVVGKARAGDENPSLTVVDLDTLEVGPDTFRGWKLGVVDWRHDNSGFSYVSKPTADERPNGEHQYWHRVWFHTRGAAAATDTLVLSDEQVKECYHHVATSHDGRWELQFRNRFDKGRVWLRDLADPAAAAVPLMDEMDADNEAQVLGGRLYVVTDWGAPRRRLMVADPAAPARAAWRELVPETGDTLVALTGVGGRLYLTYQRDVTTVIAVHAADGTRLGEVPLPTLGTATVSGGWDRPEVRVRFTSFAVPPADYTYDPDAGQLTLLHPSAIPVDPALLARIVVDQAWFHSKDGTAVPMFVIHDREATGPRPTLLTGYGGFNRSMEPAFGITTLLWVERGGVVAIPSLRGGGEYGRDWHEAGMRERKQNVFDDFLGAAQWLVDEGWTTPDRLAIAGGSNGGLLVSAAMVQRPDLFRAVLCSVPLTDMLRYHTYGLANIWSDEYGSADDPVAFEYLRAYSPYHNLVEGTAYPALLVVGSENDARTDPAHARKFFAAAQYADRDHGAERPMFLWVRGESGHHGGVTIDVTCDQLSRTHAFLMDQVGLGAAR
ncbi:MAG: prolyl oligopeptidase family serine peptidase [Myxococcota bacterium]